MITAQPLRHKLLFLIIVSCVPNVFVCAYVCGCLLLRELYSQSLEAEINYFIIIPDQDP